MAKKKNKQSDRQNQKIRGAQCRNEFLKKVKTIVDYVCGKDVYPLIPQGLLDYVYFSRITPFRFKVDQNSVISPELVAIIKPVLFKITNEKKVTLPSNQYEISLNEYHSTYLSCTMLASFAVDPEYKCDLYVKEALSKLLHNETDNDVAFNSLHSLLYSYNVYDCDLSQKLYWYQYNLVLPKNNMGSCASVITIFSETPECIRIEIDSIVRKAYRVCWAFSFKGVETISLKPSEMGIKDAIDDSPMPVYIQSHALKRIQERIDCFWPGSNHFNLYWSLVNPKISYDSNNKILIDLEFFRIKVGYLRAEIVNGIILIRTFLFITNTGTPEGRLLEKNTGLQKLDKKYLEIDKLSTFMSSDLDTNEAAKQIFISSGSSCLLEIYDYMKPFVLNPKSKYNFDFMLSYMDVNKSGASIHEDQSVLEMV